MVELSRRNIGLGAGALAGVAALGMPAIVLAKAFDPDYISDADAIALAKKWHNIKYPENTPILVAGDMPYYTGIWETVRDNTRTWHFDKVTRWQPVEKGFDLQTAWISSPVYRQWLSEPYVNHGFPPHISFCGGVVAGEKDDAFYGRWLHYAQRFWKLPEIGMKDSGRYYEGLDYQRVAT